MAYATVDDVKAVDGQTDSQYDAVIEKLLDAASTAIDGYCNVVDGFEASPVATPRLYRSTGGTAIITDECVAITLVEHRPANVWVALPADTWTPYAGDWQRPSYNRPPWSGVLVTEPVGRGGSVVLPDVRVTARWGISETVPPQVVTACIVQASRWFVRGKSKWADTVASDNFGTMVYRRSLDPDVEMMLVNARLVRPAI